MKFDVMKNHSTLEKNFVSYLVIMALNIGLLPLCSFDASAQSKAELLLKVKTAKTNKLKIKAFYDLGDLVFESNFDSAIFYYKEGYKIALKTNDLHLQHSYYSNISNVYTYQGKNDLEIETIKKALALANKIGDKLKIAKSTTNLGITYVNLGNYTEAIVYFQRALKLFKKINQTKFERKVTHFIANAYHNSNLLDKGIEYANIALRLAKAANDSLDIGDTNLTIGDCLIEKGEETKAFPYVFEAYNLFTKLDVPTKLTPAELSLSRIYNKKKQYNLAIKFAESSLKKLNSQGNDFYKINALVFLGEYYSNKYNYIKAIEFLKQAEQIAIDKNFQQHFPMIYETQLKVFAKNSDYKNAYLAFEKYHNNNDSLVSKDMKIKLHDLDFKYQTEKKEAQIKIQEAELKQKTTNNLLLIGGIIGLSLLSLMIYLNYKNRIKLKTKEITVLQKEKQLSATENIIKGQEEERGRLAKDLHDGLGGILSSLKYSLTSMTGNQILTEQGGQLFGKALSTLETAIGEMRRVAHNMMPEALVKFGLKEALQNYCDGINQSGKLKVNFQVFGLENRLEHTVEITVYRIVQELLNNVMKHAEASNVLIQLTKTQELLNLTVEDNGKGFDISSLDKTQGIGISSIESRVAYLGGTLDIKSDSKNGSSFNIEIPI